MAYSIDKSKCLRCGVCVTQCPVGAIVVDSQVTEDDGLVLYDTRIDENRCTECDVCFSFEWWCPAKAIVKPVAA